VEVFRGAGAVLQAADDAPGRECQTTGNAHETIGTVDRRFGEGRTDPARRAQKVVGPTDVVL